MLAEDNYKDTHTENDSPLPETYIFKSNEPLLLNDRETIWLVQSGSLAVFAIAVEHGTPKGKRRYLFSVKAGEAMFSAHWETAGVQHQLLAVALEETELMPVHELNRELIDRWVHHLGSTVSEMVSPRLPTPFEPTGCGILAEGEVFQPMHGTVVWAQILQGNAKFLGSIDINFSTGRIPLQTHLWLNAIDIVEIDYCNVNSITDDEILLNGIHQLQLFVLQTIQQLEQQDLQQELIRFQAREHLNNQAIATTLSNLATVFEPDHPDGSPTKPAINPEEALLIAAGAVGRFLGITIRPPAKSEDLQRVRDPLDAIARASQIRMRRITLCDQWWKQDCGAFLAYTIEEEYPVALIPISETQYDLIDPLQNVRKRCDRQTALTLSPTAYTFYRPLPEKLKALNLLQFATQGHTKELLTLIFTGIAATLIGMITPQATAILMDHAIPDANRSLLIQIALGLFATTLGTTLFQFTQGIAVTRLETFADSATQAAVWDRLLNLKVSFFRTYSIGDLSARVSVIGQIRQKLSGTILKSLFSSVFSLLNLGLLFYYNTSLALIAVFVALLNIAVTVLAGIMTLQRVRPLLDQQGKLFGMMVQIINGVAKFRVAGAEARAFAYWGQQYRQQLKLTLSTEAIEDNLTVINHILSALTPAILFACSVYFIQTGQSNQGLSTGTFLAFNTAFGTFISGATTLSTTVVDVLEVLPLWERAQPILHATPEIDTTKADPGRLSGRVNVDRIQFRYRDDGALILNNVSLHAEPGEFIAMVGPSGSGKSTLLRLLLGFDVPESGSIRYDGQELAGLDIHAVRRQLGVVLQNSRVMSASIFENIASNALISMDEAWEAARMSGLADDIATMPMGMHTVVSEGGTNLSGGQRQRLLIARALALHPRILLFDEATSALDNRTQAIVSESLDRLNVTRIVVAHRLSTIRNADQIYVLEKGQLVQRGNFDQLASQDGLFRQLIDRQL
ncbi:NHLP bacteriocin export ABC transporter permease/ATPase subunit [Leptolyngbya sp. GGD]|uniref:NHLP bacteriocin export ABC transporter permease/ATPase subunit n=1 Tax=Leptolyngbya sp. GGD TaxID=2997907 RepID=UPI00227CCE1B|nr:NHLP bacteriocin export ABC transporter permease/ATPase subunit [Leptolyngbya sp. GGD]MCY6493886.1 NHLP bacteriocin export ABC transporter permease/ATPase subunit [Leptolyngbya sp. GGD]